MFTKYKHLILPILVFILVSVIVLLYVNRNSHNDDIYKLNSDIEMYKDSINVLRSERILYDQKILDLEYSMHKLSNEESKVITVYREKIKYIDRYNSSDVVDYFNNRYVAESISKKR